MATYKITVIKDRLQESAIEKLFADLKTQGASVTITKVIKAESRADRLSSVLSDLETAVEDAKAEVETLRDEIESWKSGMEGTNLENSEKYQQLEECYDALDSLYDELDSLEIPDGSDVEFPGMY